MTFGQFSPGKAKEVINFVSRFQIPNLQLQLGLASQKLERSIFSSHFQSVRLLHLTVLHDYTLQHLFLSAARQFLCTRAEKEHLFCFFKASFKCYSNTQISCFISSIFNREITFPAPFEETGPRILQNTMLSIVQILFNSIQLGSSRACEHLLSISLNRSKLFLAKLFCCLMKASSGSMSTSTALKLTLEICLKLSVAEHQFKTICR